MPILEGDNIWIKRGRLSFPDLVKPKTTTYKDGSTSTKYGANALMEPASPDYAEAMKLVMQVATAKWGADAQAVLQMINNDKKLRCYGPGEEKVSQKTFQPYEGYPGMVVITGSSDTQPQLIGTDGQPLPPTANLNELFNGGNYCSFIYNIWAQDNAHGKAIRGNIVAVQFVEKGESFGAAPVDATSIFQQVEGAPEAAATAPAGGMPGMPGMPGAGVDPLA